MGLKTVRLLLIICVIFFLCNQIHKLNPIGGVCKEMYPVKKYIKQENKEKKAVIGKYGDNFKKIIEHYAKDNIILVTTTDLYYLDITLNFYYSSLAKFNITNYIIGCTFEIACQELRERNINHFKLGNVSKGNEYTPKYSREYRLKLHPKHRMALEALALGFSVLAMDTDFIFFQNPLNFLQKYNDYDIAMLKQYDSQYCAGFYFAHPTLNTISLHKRMVAIFEGKGANNQRTLNTLLNKIPMQIANLSLTQFPDGEVINTFTRKGCCSFTNESCCPLKNAILFHNNCILPKHSGKVYRFKEHLLWNLDFNSYYSSTKRKYLKLNFMEKSLKRKEQITVLESGFQLAYLLNRTIVLPKFYCGIKLCNFHDLFKTKITLLDDKFEHQYREHVFFQHPFVPNNIKEAKSMLVNITSESSIFDEKILKQKYGLYANISVLSVSISKDIHFTFDETINMNFKTIFQPT